MMQARVISRLQRLVAPARAVHLPPAPSADEPRLFFVRGHPRSGTNWVGRLLNLHPRICCVGEFHFEVIAEAVDRFGGLGHWGSDPAVRAAADASLRLLVRSCALTAASSQVSRGQWSGLRWVGERTPREIMPYYAEAPWMRIVRDGRDVVVSLTFHQINVDGPELSPHRERMAADIAAYQADARHFHRNPQRLLADEGWVRHAARLWADQQRSDRRALARLRAGGPGRVLELRYEELHADVEAQRARMYSFLELDPAEAAAPDRLATPGYATERPRSMDRRGAVGDWKRYFTDDARRWFTAEAGQELIEAGYESSTNW